MFVFRSTNSKLMVMREREAKLQNITYLVFSIQYYIRQKTKINIYMSELCGRVLNVSVCRPLVDIMGPYKRESKLKLNATIVA